ncbi:MAG: glycosyltransferase family 2 protein [Dokdonella sp.]
MNKISFVVPVFRNAGSLKGTHDAIAALFADALSDYELEMIFVDDGSDDSSYEELSAISAGDPRVRLIKFTRNFGQFPAMIAGYKQASGDAIVNISADMQDPVELVVDMVSQWKGGAEIAVGYRIEREDAIPATLFSRLAYGTLRLTNKQIPAGGFDYVLMSRRALETFLQYRGRNRFFQGDVLWAGYRTAFLPYVRRRREVGKSQYTFGKKLKLFFDFVIDASYLPIRLISWVGFTTATAGAIYASMIAFSWLLGRSPFVGWSPIMIALLLIGGIIMLMLGIIGEYLWRILDEVRGKPLYIVDRSSATFDSLGSSQAPELRATRPSEL